LLINGITYFTKFLKGAFNMTATKPAVSILASGLVALAVAGCGSEPASSLKNAAEGGTQQYSFKKFDSDCKYFAAYDAEDSAESVVLKMSGMRPMNLTFDKVTKSITKVEPSYSPMYGGALHEVKFNWCHVGYVETVEKMRSSLAEISRGDDTCSPAQEPQPSLAATLRLLEDVKRCR
jgi:hypothetical protein